MAATVLDASRLRQNSFERPLTYSQEAEEEVVSVRCALALPTQYSQVPFLALYKATGMEQAWSVASFKGQPSGSRPPSTCAYSLCRC